MFHSPHRCSTTVSSETTVLCTMNGKSRSGSHSAEGESLWSLTNGKTYLHVTFTSSPSLSSIPRPLVAFKLKHSQLPSSNISQRCKIGRTYHNVDHSDKTIIVEKTVRLRVDFHTQVNFAWELLVEVEGGHWEMSLE